MLAIRFASFISPFSLSVKLKPSVGETDFSLSQVTVNRLARSF